MKISRIQKVFMVFLGLITGFMLCFDTALYRAFFVNPNHFDVRYQTLSDPSIPDSMNQVSIVYLTDLEYDLSVPKEQMEELFAKIRDLNPDVMLIGGDLFASSADLNDQVRADMAGWLTSVPAPMGKFAVYGEQDLASEQHRLIVDDVYHQGQVELINNRTVLISSQSAAGIRLGGLGIESDPGALAGAFIPEQFNLLLSHWPDHVLEASQSTPLNVSYVLCGNSHGTQINWPVFGGYKRFTGSEQIDRNDMNKLPYKGYISTGVGTIDVRARLNSPAEIIYLTLTNGK